MKRLSASKLGAMRSMLLSGYSVREIARLLGVARARVSQYRRVLTPPEKQPHCPCGRPFTHQGWCEYRMRRKPNAPGRRPTGQFDRGGRTHYADAAD